MATVKDFYDFVNAHEEIAVKLNELNRDMGEFYNSFEYLVENFGISESANIEFKILNTVDQSGSYDPRASLELEVVTENNLILLFLFNSISEEFLAAWLNR